MQFAPVIAAASSLFCLFPSHLLVFLIHGNYKTVTNKANLYVEVGSSHHEHLCVAPSPHTFAFLGLGQ
jgi:hypothetical protein